MHAHTKAGCQGRAALAADLERGFGRQLIRRFAYEFDPGQSRFAEASDLITLLLHENEVYGTVSLSDDHIVVTFDPVDESEPERHTWRIRDVSTLIKVLMAFGEDDLVASDELDALLEQRGIRGAVLPYPQAKDAWLEIHWNTPEGAALARGFDAAGAVLLALGLTADKTAEAALAALAQPLSGVDPARIIED